MVWRFLFLYVNTLRWPGSWAGVRIDPVVILAQAAIETGWGESTLCREYHNFFGITAYGLPNVWWTGRWTELSSRSLRFRIYPDDKCSFMDYCRLLRSAYPRAAT